MSAGAANGNRGGGPGSSPSTSRIDEGHIERLWEMMGMIYGYKWQRQFGASDDGTWLVGLQEFTPEEIRQAINWLIQEQTGESSGSWPPNLVGFRARCRQVRDWAIDLPSCEQSLQEVRAKGLIPARCPAEWSDPLIGAAFERFGGRAQLERVMLAGNMDELAERWRAAWERTVADYRAGRIDERGVTITSQAEPALEG